MKPSDELIKKLISYLDKGENLMAEQLPTFAKEVIDYAAWVANWAFYLSAILFGICFIACIVTWIVTLVKDREEHYWGVALWGFGVIVFSSMAWSNFKDLNMYEKAPKLYLIKVLKRTSEGR